MDEKYQNINDIEADPNERIAVGVKQLDTILGGGFAPSETIFIAGSPGFGKSTLLLQVSLRMAKKGHRVLYAGGEESLGQIKQRADRLGTVHENIFASEATSLEELIEVMDKLKPHFIIIDSLQMLYSNAVKGQPNSKQQLEYCMRSLIAYTKARGLVMMIIGHATKSGVVAGFNTLQHMVDVVMFMERDISSIRKLMVDKNRYGPGQTGMELHMTDQGFSELREGWTPGFSFTSPFANTVSTGTGSKTLGYWAATVILWILMIPIFLVVMLFKISWIALRGN